MTQARHESPAALSTTLARNWIRWSIASVWLFDVACSWMPTYQTHARRFFSTLNPAPSFFLAIAAIELVFGIWLLLRPLSTASRLAQAGFLLALSFLLSAPNPWLLAHPLGMITKNIPIFFLLWIDVLLTRDGLQTPTWWWLRVAMASIWFTEGIFPKVLFPQAWELKMVGFFGLDWIPPRLFLAGLGLAQVASGIAALTLQGRWLRFVLYAHLFAMALLPLLVLIIEPFALFLPYGPLIKNIPICAGTVLLLRWHTLRSQQEHHA